MNVYNAVPISWRYPGDILEILLVSVDKSGKEKKRLSPSWSTPDPKQVKHTHVDKTGYLL